MNKFKKYDGLYKRESVLRENFFVKIFGMRIENINVRKILEESFLSEYMIYLNKFKKEDERVQQL